jgi:hypothetical protein
MEGPADLAAKDVTPSGRGSSVKTKHAESLPKMLPGVVRPQWVRCGRPGCRCVQGERHGPYYYRFWREAGKLKKAYVRPADLEQVRAWCEAHRQARQELRAGWEIWRGLLAALRQLEQA